MCRARASPAGRRMPVRFASRRLNRIRLRACTCKHAMLCGAGLPLGLSTYARHQKHSTGHMKLARSWQRRTLSAVLGGAAGIA